MYRAKNAGGGGYSVFDAALHDAAVRRLRLETDLRRAVEREEFRVWASRRVSPRAKWHFEALVRWQHPERGLLAPAPSCPSPPRRRSPRLTNGYAEARRQSRTWQVARPDRVAPSLSVNLGQSLTAGSGGARGAGAHRDRAARRGAAAGGHRERGGGRRRACA
jgi:predicted signal transduction protein with EAL and GGDEF domain